MAERTQVSVDWERLPAFPHTDNSYWSIYSSVFVGHELFVFPSRSQPRRIYVLNMNTRRWTRAYPRGAIPPLLGYSAVFLINEKLHFLKPNTAHGRSLVNIFDVLNMEWSRIELVGNALPGRGFCLADFWEARGRVLFLGNSEDLNLFEMRSVDVESWTTRYAGVEKHLTVEVYGDEALERQQCYSSLFMATKEQWVVCCGRDRPSLYVIDVSKGNPRWECLTKLPGMPSVAASSPFLAGSHLLLFSSYTPTTRKIIIVDYDLRTGELSEKRKTAWNVPSGSRAASASVVSRNANEFVYIARKRGRDYTSRVYLGRVSGLS